MEASLHPNTKRPGTIHAFLKWIWGNEYRGLLIGVIGFLISLIAGSVAILAICINNNTDLQILRYVAKAIVILCCILFAGALLLGVVGSILSASSVGKQILGVVGLFTTKKK
jgi:hypothetical protein